MNDLKSLSINELTLLYSFEGMASEDLDCVSHSPTGPLNSAILNYVFSAGVADNARTDPHSITINSNDVDISNTEASYQERETHMLDNQSNEDLFVYTVDQDGVQALYTTTGNQATVQVLPTATGNQATVDVLPTANGNQATVDVLPTATGNQATVQVLPTTTGNQATVDVLPTTTGNQSTVQAHPTTTGNQAGHTEQQLGMDTLNAKKYKCILCLEVFESMNLLLKHRAVQHYKPLSDDKRFLCRRCGCRFKTKASLSAHWRVHKQGDPYRCEFCAAQFVFQAGLLKHLQVCGTLGEKKRVKKYKQNILRKSLKKYKFTETKSNFYCDLCSCFYLSQSALTSHKIKVHKVISKPHKQPKNCVGFKTLKIGKMSEFEKQKLSFEKNEFWNVNYFVNDMEIEGSMLYKDEAHPEKTNSLDCHEKDKKKNNVNALRIDGKVYQCLFCRQCFKERHEVRKHVIAHKTICSDCGKRSIDLPRLRRHRLNAHGSESDGVFKCPNCEKLYGNRAELLSHMKDHVGPWVCERGGCGAQFSERRDLVLHRKGHGNSDPDQRTAMFDGTVSDKLLKGLTLETINDYIEKQDTVTVTSVGKVRAIAKCKICREQFTNATITRKHIKMVHLKDGVKKFQCDKCDFSTHFGYHFKKHLEKHTKPFSCHICARTYNTQTKLNKHLSYHNMDKYQCFYCSEMFLSKKRCIEHISVFHSSEKVKQQNIQSEVQSDFATGPDAENILMNDNITNAETLELKDSNSKLVQVSCTNTRDRTGLDNSGDGREALRNDSNVDGVNDKAILDINSKDKAGLANSVEGTTEGLDKSSNVDGGNGEAIFNDEAVTRLKRKRGQECKSNNNVVGSEDGSRNCRSESEIQQFGHGTDTFQTCGAGTMVIEDIELQSNTSEITRNTPIENSQRTFGNSKTTKTMSDEHVLERFPPICTEFGCAVCGEKYTSESEFLGHLIQSYTTHSSCNLCKTEFVSNTALEQHMLGNHSSGKTLVCPKCGASFFKEGDYCHHARRHAGIFTCHLCENKTFSKNHDLQRHLAGHLAKGVACVLCGQAVQNNIQLAVHKYRVHEIKIRRSWANKKLTGSESDVQDKLELEKVLKEIGMTEDNNTNMDTLGLDPAGKDCVTYIDSHGHSIQASHAEQPVAEVPNTKVSITPQIVDVPNSDVTLEVYADGTIITKDKQGTNFSQINLETLGVDLNSLEGDTNLELSIVQSNGVEVKVTIQLQIEKYQGLAEGIAISDLTTLKLDNHGASVPITPKLYECSKCPRTFKLPETFHRHELIHEGGVVFACPVCKRAFGKKKNLSTHLKLHGEKIGNFNLGSMKINNEWRCSQCAHIFKARHSLQRHIRVVHERKEETTCPYCGKRFSTEDGAQRHIVVHLPPFVCSFCSKEYKSREELQEHIKQDHFRSYICPICKAHQLNKKSFSSHVKRFHCDTKEGKDIINELKVHQCSMCSRRFEKKSTLKRHHLSHGSVTDMLFHCPFCDSKFNLKCKLNDHLRSRHREHLEHQCDICDIEFFTDKDLNVHLKLRHRKHYFCKFCNQKLENYKEYTDHCFTVHGSGHQCKECNKIFISNNGLLRHRKKSHPASSDRARTCDMRCDDFPSTGKIKLPEHKSDQHVEELLEEMVDAVIGVNEHAHESSELASNNTCDLCGFITTQNTELRKHYLVKHFKRNENAMLRRYPNLNSNSSKTKTGKLCENVKTKDKILDLITKTYGRKSKGMLKRNARKSKNSHKNDDNFSILSVKGKIFKCGVCGESFNKKSTLKKHTLVHEKYILHDNQIKTIDTIQPLMFKCETCGNVYATKQGLSTHVRHKHLNESVKSTEKNSGEPTMDKDRKETGTSIEMDNQGMYPCTQCKALYKTCDGILKHIKSRHPDELPVKSTARNPSKVSKSGRIIKKSLKTLDQIQCDVCCKQFLHEKSFLKHLVTCNQTGTIGNAYSSDDKVLTCQFCNKVFKDMQTHIHEKHGDRLNEPKFKETIAYDYNSLRDTYKECDLFERDTCKKKFQPVEKSIGNKAGRHCQSKPGNRKVSLKESKLLLYKCKECTVSFKTRMELNSHKDEHHQHYVSRKLFETNFDKKETAAFHEVTRQRHFQCVKCTKTFTRASNLEKHVRDVHSPIDILVCGMCNKVFPDEDSMRSHLKEHACTSNRDKSDHKTSIAVTEIRGIARPNREMSCNVCKKSFSKMSHLLEHMIVHTSMSNERSQEVGITKYSTQITNLDNSKTISTAGNAKARRTVVSAKGNKKRPTCRHCKKDFDSRHHFQVHVINVHNRISSFVKDRFCRECRVLFKTNTKFLQHCNNIHKKKKVTMNQTVEGPAFECEHCNKGYRTFTGLKKHRKLINCGKGKSQVMATTGRLQECLMCIECQQLYKTEKEYKEHLSVFHKLAKDEIVVDTLLKGFIEDTFSIKQENNESDEIVVMDSEAAEDKTVSESDGSMGGLGARLNYDTFIEASTPDDLSEQVIFKQIETGVQNEKTSDNVEVFISKDFTTIPKAKCVSGSHIQGVEIMPEVMTTCERQCDFDTLKQASEQYRDEHNEAQQLGMVNAQKSNTDAVHDLNPAICAVINVDSSLLKCKQLFSMAVIKLNKLDMSNDNSGYTEIRSDALETDVLGNRYVVGGTVDEPDQDAGAVYIDIADDDELTFGNQEDENTSYHIH